MGSVFRANQSVIPHSASAYLLLGLSGTLRGSHSMSQSFEEHTKQIQNVPLIIVCGSVLITFLEHFYIYI